jgi:hypothetical protein
MTVGQPPKSETVHFWGLDSDLLALVTRLYRDSIPLPLNRPQEMVSGRFERRQERNSSTQPTVDSFAHWWSARSYSFLLH